MAGVVWFGTRDYMQWIPAPAVNVQAGKQGFATTTQFVTGGAAVRRSTTAAKKFSMSWNLARRGDIQPVLDFADGHYGPGPFYYSNPFAQDRNVLPSYWATPFVNGIDGPVRVGGVRPTLTSEAVTNGYPLQSANYTLTATSTVPSIFIPVPPGYVAHVGAHGQVMSGTSNVTIREFVGTTGGAVNNLTLLPKTGALTNYTTPEVTTGIELSFKATNASVLRLHGLIVQVLPVGSVGPSGAFVSGQGQSGMAFASSPVVSEYNAVLDRVGVNAELIEVEAWV